jgi:transposase-like protein
MKKERRQFSAQDKVAILRRHLVDKVPVSDLCDQHQIQPAQFYQWQKQFFENGAAAFGKAGRQKRDLQAERIAALEQKLVKKNEVVAELLQEHVQLKKELGEL